MKSFLKKMSASQRYIAVTYAAFWLGILLIGAVYLMTENDVIMALGSTLLSWTPTAVLLIMFNKLLPGCNRKTWIKEAFSAKTSAGMMAAIALAFVLSAFLACLLTLGRNGLASIDMSKLSPGAVAGTIFTALISGATGEELGWRGYLQRHYEEHSGNRVIKSALKVALVWSFWHMPLWFVSAAGQSMAFLLNYIVTFIGGNVCMAVIMAVCYKRCRNLLIPMWIHFLSNVTLTLASPFFTDAASVMEGRLWILLFYILSAAAFVVWNKLRKQSAETIHL